MGVQLNLMSRVSGFLRSGVFLATVVVSLLSGCALLPGSFYKGGVSESDSAQMNQDLESVRIRVVDSKLISEIKSAGQGAVKTNVADVVDLAKYEYRLGIGDVLSIAVWDHPELAIPAAVQRTAEFDGFRIQPDGTITFAYAPNLPAVGKTISEFRKDLIHVLGKVIRDPQVDVKVVGFNSQKIYVTGEVKEPGVYPITEVPLTLVDAVNRAGGLTEKADWRLVTLNYKGEPEAIRLDNFYVNGDVSQNRLMKDGMILHIDRVDQQKVFVLGDVIKAGGVFIGRYGLTLAEALSETGGINENTANANGIFVLRKRDLEQDGIIADVYQLQASNPVAMVFADQFPLQSRDIVYVTAAPVSLWNRLITQLLPSLTAASVLKNGF